MALTLLHADTFDRSDRDLNGDTMSDGLGVWQYIGVVGSADIVSNQGTISAGGLDRLLIDSAMSSVADQKAEIVGVTKNTFGGPVCRQSSGLDNYYVYFNGDGDIYKHDTGGFTNLGSGSTPTDTDTIALEAIGTTINGYINGVLAVSLTDSSHASGKCGLYGGGGVTPGTFDDFADYVEPSGSSVPVFVHHRKMQGVA